MLIIVYEIPTIYLAQNPLEVCNKKDVLNLLFLVNISIYKFNILGCKKV